MKTLSDKIQDMEYSDLSKTNSVTDAIDVEDVKVRIQNVEKCVFSSEKDLIF